MSRRTVVNLVFFLGVFFLMVFWAVNNIVTIDRLERPYRITGDFAAASGVLANAEVAYLGVHYGSVSSVERQPGGVRITMKIDRQRHIPDGAIARIFRKSAVGEPYIDFVPPEDFDADDDAFIEAGDNVPIERTTIPLEFSELLRSASELVSAIDPEKTNTLVHELALGLVGRGESLRRLTEASDQLAATFAEKTDVLDRLATNNTKITRVVTEHRGSFGSSLTNLRLLAESLRNAQGDTSVLLDRGSDLMHQTADLVASQKANLDCLLGDLEHVIDATTTPARLQGLATLLDLGPRGFGNLWATRDEEADGVWVRTNLTAPTENAAQQYVPPTELPAVPAVPGCTSQFGTGVAGSSFVPPVFGRDGGRPWPQTAGLALATAAFTVALAAAGFRRTRRLGGLAPTP